MTEPREDAQPAMSKHSCMVILDVYEHEDGVPDATWRGAAVPD
jgi:hypothetical protein